MRRVSHAALLSGPVLRQRREGQDFTQPQYRVETKLSINKQRYQQIERLFVCSEQMSWALSQAGSPFLSGDSRSEHRQITMFSQPDTGVNIFESEEAEELFSRAEVVLSNPPYEDFD